MGAVGQKGDSMGNETGPDQIGGEAQVDYSQKGYEDEVGRVWEAGQVDDHEVEVDGTDQGHDEGCDGLAQPAIGKLLHEGWHAGERKDRQHRKGKQQALQHVEQVVET